MITGLIEYKNETCVFKLHENTYVLEIEEINNREDDSLFLLKKLMEDRSRKLNPEEKLLIGKDFDKGKLWYFYTGSFKRNSGPKTHAFNLKSYIRFNSNETSFDGFQIQSDELNWFHNISKAYDSNFFLDNEKSEKRIEIKPFEEIDKEFYFNFNGQNMRGTLGMKYTISHSSTSPLKLISNLNYYFERTCDVDLIENLTTLTKQLLQILTYKRSHRINNLILKKKVPPEGKYKEIGRIFIKDSLPVDNETEKNIKKQIIKYQSIENNFQNLLEKLSENKIYLKHIPDTWNDKYKNSNNISARFIMVTAGFEWQFKFSYKEQSKVSDEKFKNQKEEILQFLEQKVDSTTGKEKKYFKGVKKDFERNNSSLSEKILWALNQFNNILDIFISHIYQLNDIENYHAEYRAISERIQEQRNRIAHGNIEEDLNEFIVLDMLVLEWLYYAMVLDEIGVKETEIQHIINNLFNVRLAI